MKFPLRATLLFLVPFLAFGADVERVSKVELQSLLVQVDRLKNALQYLGEPLPSATLEELEKAKASKKKVRRSRYDPAKQNYSLRFKDWRYVRYENGKEELYHTAKDNHEWNNLALDSNYSDTLKKYRKELLSIIPESIPGKPKFNEFWKDQYFKKNPKADAN